MKLLKNIIYYHTSNPTDTNISAYMEPYRLSQSGRIAYDDLKKNLKPHGYYPSKRTPGLWLYLTRQISFTFVVDNFGVKYINKKDADHLFDAIRTNYPVKIDWTGTKYLGIKLKWNYDTIHKNGTSFSFTV